LRAGDDDIDTPLVHAKIHRRQGRDGIDEKQCRMPGGVDRAAQLGNVVDDPGRGLVVHHQHRLDRVLAILPQPAFELRRIGGGPPIVGQCLDLEAEGFTTHAPIEREEPTLHYQ
jgi:hypothetical protein